MLPFFTVISGQKRSIGAVANGGLVAAVFVSLVLTSVGCSEVHFSPAPDSKPVGTEAPPRDDTPGDGGGNPIPDTPTPDPDPVPDPVPVPVPVPDQLGSEVFNQNSFTGALDILIVEDTSYTMRSNRFDLYTKLQNFKSDLAGLDWQIGVTTNDVGGGTRTNGNLVQMTNYGPYVLTPQSNNNEFFFEKGISLLQCNDEETFDYLLPPCMVGDLERDFQAATMAINEPGNSQLFRDDVPLAIVFISNEDEMGDATHPDSMSTEDVLGAFDSKWGASKKVTTFGVIIEPEDNACLANETQPFADPGAHYGYEIASLASQTGGATHSICAGSYSPLMQKVAAKAAPRPLLTHFVLAHEPKAGSVVVELSPSQSVNWTIQGKQLIFNQAPVRGTTISVEYKY